MKSYFLSKLTIFKLVFQSNCLKPHCLHNVINGGSTITGEICHKTVNFTSDSSQMEYCMFSVQNRLYFLPHQMKHLSWMDQKVGLWKGILHCPKLASACHELSVNRIEWKFFFMYMQNNKAFRVYIVRDTIQNKFRAYEDFINDSYCWYMLDCSNGVFYTQEICKHLQNCHHQYVIQKT